MERFLSPNPVGSIGSIFLSSNSLPLGAGVTCFAVFSLNSSTIQVDSIVSDHARSWTRVDRVASASKSLEVWSIPYLYTTQEFLHTVVFSSAVTYSVATFYVDGTDLNDTFGTPVHAFNNASTVSTLSLTDGEYDSFILDFFASSGGGTLTPATSQQQAGVSIGSPAISVSWKESALGNDAVQHTASVSGEILHIAVVVKGMFRRDAAYLAFLDDENVERTFLAEIGCAEENITGWTAITPTLPALDVKTLSSVTTFAHSGATGSNRFLIVTVFSLVNSDNVTGVTHNGKVLKFAGNALNTSASLLISTWYLVNPDTSGNVVVTVSGTAPTRVEARTFKNVNQSFPYELVNSFQSTSTTFSFIQSAVLDDMMVGSVLIGSNQAVTAIGTGHVADSNANGATFGIATSHQIVDTTNVVTPTLSWSWTGTVSMAAAVLSLHPVLPSAVYSTPWVRVKTSGDDHSGIQRNFDHIEVNGAEFFKQNTLAAMASQRSRGSFYYDSATETVYVRMNSDVSPLQFASISMEFYWLVGDRLTDFIGGDYYDPRLTGVLPSVSGQMGDLLFGITSYPTGNIQLSNADKFFDYLSPTLEWKNRKVRMYSGGGSLPRKRYRLIATMFIDDQQAGYEFFEIQLRAKGNTLQTQLPDRTLDDYYGNVSVTGNASKFLPLIYGQIKSVPMFALNLNASGPRFVHQYTVAGFLDNLGVTAIRAFNKSTGATTALLNDPVIGDYILSGGFIYTAAIYTPEAYDLIADVGSEAYIGATIQAILTRIGVGLDEIDAHSFASVDVEEPLAIGIWQQEQVAAEQIIRALEQSGLCALAYTADGLWSLKQFVPTSENFDVIPALADENLASFPQPEFRPVTPFFEVVLFYAYQPFYTFFEQTSALDINIIGQKKTQETFYRSTALTKSGDAEAIAGRYHAIQNSQPVTFRITETGFKLLDCIVLDQFRLSLRRAPSVTGSWSDEVVEVLSYEKTFNPPSITVTIDNMHGIETAVKMAAPDGGDDWDTSIATDRAMFGFAADDATERVDVTDPSTEGQAIAW